MLGRPSTRKKKDLNMLSSNTQNMKRGARKLKDDKLGKAIKEAQKDPNFIREIKRFIKATTKVYKLH